MRENKSIISVNNVSMVFNLASEKVDSLKEYVQIGRASCRERVLRCV